MHKSNVKELEKQEKIDIFSVGDKKIEFSFEVEEISSNTGLPFFYHRGIKGMKVFFFHIFHSFVVLFNFQTTF